LSASHEQGEFKPDEPFRVTGPEEHGSMLVLRLEGEFDLAAVPAFQAATEGLTGSSVVLDLRPLSFIDSSGLAALVRLHLRLEGAGGHLECVVPPEGAVRRAFELAMLDDTLTICGELPD
jgi:anti-sigma B factor antagonist